MRHARIAFGDRVVASDLTLEFAAGRTTCLLGRSGVGKTSLLRWLAGLLPDTGPGPNAGRPLPTWPNRTCCCPGSRCSTTCCWATACAATRQRSAAAGPRARALLAEVGLHDRLDDLPQVLSGGMRQRAALARTLCEDRPVVLMDEPFAHLDAVTRLELQDLAGRLLAGRTVVLVTHDPLEALRLGHQVRVLSGPPLSAGPAIEPPGAVPRDPADPALLALQARLIAELRGRAA